MNLHPPYTRLEPASGPAPLVLDSPHSGTTYPDDFGACVTLDQLRQAEDTHVDELFSAAPSVGATLVVAQFPRAYIDPNRSLLDMDASLLAEPWPGPMVPGRKTQQGIGLIWRRLDTGEPIYARKLSVAEVTRRITQFHQPYQKAVKDALDQTHARFGAVWHLNCHSMPAVSTAVSDEGPGVARPDFVLGDRDGSTCEADFTHFVREQLAAMGYAVKVNDPYKGVELVRAFSDPGARRHSLQIEVNRRLYMDERTREKSAAFAALAADVHKLLVAIAAYAGARAPASLPGGAHDHAHCEHDHGHCNHDHGHHHGHRDHGRAEPAAVVPVTLHKRKPPR
jgi:N-formylglutamate amidohydrolase